MKIKKPHKILEGAMVHLLSDEGMSLLPPLNPIKDIFIDNGVKIPVNFPFKYLPIDNSIK